MKESQRCCLQRKAYTCTSCAHGVLQVAILSWSFSSSSRDGERNNCHKSLPVNAHTRRRDGKGHGCDMEQRGHFYSWKTE